MNHLFSVLISTLKARITPIWTRLRYWTSWNFIRSKILTKIRMTLSSIFKVKPRDKDDYYPLFHYLVSKRLVRAVIVVLGILCLCYFVWANPVSNVAQSVGSGENIYSYNSVFLRFAKGPVKIKAKSGYVAYDGNVEKGYVTGLGTLYDENGAVVYNGNFEKNEYSGQGTLFYPIGQVKYQGEFQKNLFQGTGIFYRENGTKQYMGQFARGVFEGEGTLYNVSEVPVFHGNFHSGELVYEQLLQKTPSEIAEYYTGDLVLYLGEKESAVLMKDIDALYVTAVENNSIETETKASSLFVYKNEFVYGEKHLGTVEELCEALGKPIFEGNSYVTFPEAVGIHVLEEKGAQLPMEMELEVSQEFDEVKTVDSFTGDVLVYLYVFEADGITYTFFTSDRNGGFYMYEMAQ